MKARSSRIRHRILIPFLLALIDKVFADRSKPLDPAPVFILGSGRNGSTLTASILNTHPDMFIPPEEYLLPSEILNWKLYGHRNPKKFLDNMLNRFLVKESDPKWEVEGITSEQLLSGLKEDEVCFSRLFDQLVREYARSKGKEIKVWGDKTPILTHYIDQFYPVFRNSAYIMLIRDPRDVALSYLKMHNHSKEELLFGMWRWNDSVRAYHFLQQKGAKVLLVKYEDLVSNTDEIFHTIQEFIGVKPIDGIAQKDRDAKLLGADKLAHLQNIKRAVGTNSIGKWKKELDEESIQLIMPLVEKTMHQFGYE